MGKYANGATIPTAGKTLDEFIGGLHLAYDSFKEKEVEVLAVIANKVQEKNIEIIKAGVEKNLPKDVFVSVIPLISSLINPTIKEIAEAIDAKVLFGGDYLDNQVTGVKVGAMQLRNYLTYLEETHLHQKSVLWDDRYYNDNIAGRFFTKDVERWEQIRKSV